MNAIEIKNITKSYDDFILDNISFNVPAGSIMGLVGENGAGKSTTIKLIMNSIVADSGIVHVFGTSNKSKDFINIRQDIGIVLDEAYYPEVLNAKNINSIMKLTYINWNEDIYKGYLDKFKLPLNKKFKEYSRGMKMKLAIAVAISHNPQLLVLDEPTSGLDPMVRDEILDIFLDFTHENNHSILFSSHIISDLEKICDYISFIHKGKLVMCEKKEILLSKYVLAKISTQDCERLNYDAIVSKKKSGDMYEVLLIKDKLELELALEKPTLEDIILFMSKEAI